MFCTETDVIQALINQTPFLDVRAQTEFVSGSLPCSVNIPILDNNERQLVGTCYKKQGPDAAIRLGESLVSGENKIAKVTAWSNFIKKNPDSLLFCFRGGQRSQYAQSWLKESGIYIPRIDGGYKKVRQYLLTLLSETPKSLNTIVITGQTGSGKTTLLHKLAPKQPVVDLEQIAKHRGSAFGNLSEPQPSQVNFENSLAVRLLQISKSHSYFLTEDESRTIGLLSIPAPLFLQMSNAEVIVINDPIEHRIDRIYDEYVLRPLLQASNVVGLSTESPVKRKLIHSLERISKRLGGARTQEIGALLSQAFEKGLDRSAHEAWIHALLTHYYDPMYLNSIEKRSRVLFKGSHDEVETFLTDNSSTFARRPEST